MTKRMLIDTTHAEETRVVVLDGNRLDDYDVETSAKKQLKGNIYLAKIVRIEPSLQAAFVEYGGNRHGFLAFAEIHPDYYQIPVADRERLIALQEEEARAEDARADRDDDDARSDRDDDDARSDRDDDDARSDRDDDEREAAGGHETEAEAGHEDDRLDDPRDEDVVETTAQALPDEPDGERPDAADTDEAPAALALEIPSEALRGDLLDEGVEAGVAPDDAASSEVLADAQSDTRTDTQPLDQDNDVHAEPAQPAPETVGGESVDDGHAQRRTARFLRQYKIQEVMRRRQILLIQVVKEERGNKGAALTTYISLAGRFCVLMPNSLRGGGVSRKITSAADRRRLKEITSELEIPRGMAMIVRTAGAQRPRPEIKRDCEYLLRTWDDIRETTMQSTAPCLVYEEASLIKRAIRDVYTRDIEEIVVDGEPGWKGAREFMRTLMPSNANKVNLWRDPAQKLFSHYQVEHHLDAMLQPNVQLRSGGYLVINQTEALVAIDVNSGRSTRERSVEDTALRTNMEAADEVARQLRLRDLAGLIVIDFIDMEARRHNGMVERRLKDALRNDRARIQVGTISHFGLMEMSRQRLRPSLAESSFVACSHCNGSGFMRGTESSALHVLRAIEEEAGQRKAGEIVVHLAASVALYVLNNKRGWLQEIEARHHMTVHLAVDDSLIPPALRIEKTKPYVGPPAAVAASVTRIPIEAMPATDADDATDWVEEPADEPVAARTPRVAEAGRAPAPAPREAAVTAGPAEAGPAAAGEDPERRGKRRRRRRRGGRREDGSPQPDGEAGADAGAPPGHSRFEPGDEFDEDEQPNPGVPSDSPDVPSTFEAGEGGRPVAPLLADAGGARAPQSEPEGRGRRRRGGRNRSRPDSGGQSGAAGGSDGAELEDPFDAPRQTAPRAYNGPTPADPFAGSFDIFEMMERDADETVGLAREPSASAASFAAPPPMPSPEPVAALDALDAPAAAVPEQAPTETVATGAEDAAASSPEPDLVETAEAPAVPAAKVKRPRASRARKPAVGETAGAAAEVPEALAPTIASEALAPTIEPEAPLAPTIAADANADALAVVPEAPTPPAAAQPKPARARSPRTKRVTAAPTTVAPEAVVADTVPEATVADTMPEAVVADTVPEPAAVSPADAATPPGGPDPSIVQPVVIGDAVPAAARRTGWWKR